MSTLRRRTVDTTIEENILKAMITSDTFCRDVSSLISKETIETPYLAKAVRWCQKYYSKYKQAPQGHIQDLFEVEKGNLEESEITAIETLLIKLSEEYETASINEDFIKDQAYALIKSRALKFVSLQTNALIEAGRIEEAEKLYHSYQGITVQATGWEDPFAPSIIKNHFADKQSKKNYLFQMPGELGRFLGAFSRKTLLGILAPTKRGKSFWLIELALQSVFSKRRTIIISLEMDKARVRDRIYNRMTSMAPESKDYIYPVFDCVKNQENSCNMACRTNNIRLLDSEGQKPAFDRDNLYRPCSACRGNRDFVPATWFTSVFLEKMKFNKAKALISSQVAHFGYNNTFGSNLRILAYPAFSANLSRIRGDINMLVDQGFIPETISLDYADILAPEDARVTGRDRIDETWKSLKRMGDELSCFIASASQSNRGSFDKKNVVQTDAAEDIRKISNSDIFLALNQTPQEKRASITRVSKIAVRDGEFDQYEGCIVLQQLSLGQICLDSYLDRPTTVSNFNLEDFLI